ncbi:MAG: hypothetical protein DRJ45_06930 [Thermoprotei archaeon]|nr:MAG: hypothetical protein DRJ45_06930 [Thermoprotei archaeon]
MAILITNSRRSNPRIRSFTKDLVRCLPQAFLLKRGKLSLNEIKKIASENNFHKMIIICRGLHGNPGKMLFYNILNDRLKITLILKICGIKLLREFNKKDYVMSEANTGIIYVSGNSKSLEIAYLLSDALDMKTIYRIPIEEIMCSVDTIIYIYENNNIVEIKFLDGYVFKENGPLIKVKSFKYFEKREKNES